MGGEAKAWKNINIAVDRAEADAYLAASKSAGLTMRDGVVLAMLNQRLRWRGVEGCAVGIEEARRRLEWRERTDGVGDGGVVGG